MYQTNISLLHIKTDKNLERASIPDTRIFTLEKPNPFIDLCSERHQDLPTA